MALRLDLKKIASCGVFRSQSKLVFSKMMTHGDAHKCCKLLDFYEILQQKKVAIIQEEQAAPMVPM